MPSTRRTILRSAGVALVVSLAGCGGEASSSEPDCSSRNFDHADPEVIRAASVHPDGDDVLFAVRLEEEADLESLDLIRAFDEDGGLAFSIPVVAGDGAEEPRRRYEQHLGPRPRHGRYRVEAVDADGDVVDEVTADVHCYRETEE